MLWKWLKKVKDVYSWYSFASGIAGLTGLSLILSPVIALVLGVVGAVIKGVPWPITVMAGFCTLVAVAYLIALPIFIKSAMQATQTIRTIQAQQLASDPNNTPQPIRPHWDALKHVEKFTVHQAACLLENLDPSTHPKDPKISAWMDGLCAAIRTGQLAFIPEREMSLQHASMREVSKKLQQQEANSQTEIPKAALMDFAKRNDRDLKYLG
jgi:hypothetical protein